MKDKKQGWLQIVHGSHFAWRQSLLDQELNKQP